jgi:hypothetical protein
VFLTSISSLPGTLGSKRNAEDLDQDRLRVGTSVPTPSAPNAARRSHAMTPANTSAYGLGVGGIDQCGRFASPPQQRWCRWALPWSMDLRAVEKSHRQ